MSIGTAADVGGECFDGSMDAESALREQTRALREQNRALWATAVCFLVGAALGAVLLHGAARPLAGPGSIMVPAAIVAGAVAAIAFVVSTLVHRRGETAGMPRWQRVVSDVSLSLIHI